MMMTKTKKATKSNVGKQVKKNYLQRVGWPQARIHKSVVPKPKIRFGSGFKMSSIKPIIINTTKI